MELPEISITALTDKRKLEKQDSGFHTMSFKNTNFKTVEEENEANDKENERDTLACGAFSRDVSVDSAMSSAIGYHPVRRHCSQDGDVEENKSLLLDDPEEDLMHKELPGSTILVNTNGALVPPTASKSEDVELKDLSVGGATAASTSYNPVSSLTPFLLPGQNVHRNGGKRHVTIQDNPPRLQPPHIVHPPQHTERQPPLSENERGRQIRILQRELSRIQTELRALGELEIEVSYV